MGCSAKGRGLGKPSRALTPRESRGSLPHGPKILLKGWVLDYILINMGSIYLWVALKMFKVVKYKVANNVQP